MRWCKNLTLVLTIKLIIKLNFVIHRFTWSLELLTNNVKWGLTVYLLAAYLCCPLVCYVFLIILITLCESDSHGAMVATLTLPLIIIIGSTWLEMVKCCYLASAIFQDPLNPLPLYSPDLPIVSPCLLSDAAYILTKAFFIAMVNGMSFRPSHGKQPSSGISRIISSLTSPGF